MTLAVLETSPAMGSIHSFEPGDKVLLKTWTTGSRESQLESGLGLGMYSPTPHLSDTGRNKTWIHHTTVKKAPEQL